MIWPVFLCSLILTAFNNYLLNTYVLGTVLGTSNTTGRHMGEEQGKFRYWEGNMEPNIETHRYLKEVISVRLKYGIIRGGMGTER